MKRILPVFVLTICALAKTNPRTCGSGPGKREELRLVAAQNRQLRRVPARAPSLSATRTIGDLVVMEASGGIVSERNAFNLEEQRVTFTPVAGTTAYAFSTGAGALLPAGAANRTLTELGDDDTAGVALPFSFPYFGARYSSVWINSDGNLTFDRPDTASSDRSLGRFTAGPPRLAPLFMDLDPSRAGAVTITSTAERFTVTWLAVPEYASVGVGQPNTFQVALYPDGRVEFVYQSVTTLEAVTGIARGRLEGAASIVSLRNGSGATYTSSIAERFSQGNEIDMVTLSQRFYERFEDAYDYLVVYNNMGISPGPGVVAYEVTVRNDRAGYGDVELDDGAQYGSRRRLQAVLNLGPLSQYPADPYGLVPARLSARDTPLSILGHEAGHLFLAFASVRDPQNAAARPMLGVQNAHWAFAFNSEASLLEGNRIRDFGPGVTPRFETVGSSEGYAPLDQYLMGFRAPEDVPPSFYVADSSLGFLLRPPQTGVRFDGRRQDVTIDELIAAAGRRTPDHTVAQRRYRFAFILLVRPGEEPAPEQVAQVELYRASFPAYYSRATGERAAAETTVRQALAFAAQPAAGILRGATSTFRVEMASPVAAPLTLTLSATPEGVVGVPASVTIPAGASFALVPVTGLSAGVASLMGDSVGGRFETALTRVQVADARGLRPFVREADRQQILRFGRDPEPVVVRAADFNRAPYPGVAITASATGVALEATTLTAGAAGEAVFRVRPSSAGPVTSATELRFRVGDSPAEQRVLLAGTPVVADGGVVNAASYSPGLSPAALVAMFGVNLSAQERAESAPFPGATTLAGTQLLLNGAAQRLLYVADRQINFALPAGLAPDVYEIEVRTPAGTSEKKSVSVEAAWPGLFAAVREGAQVRLVATGLGARVDPEARVGGVLVPVIRVRLLAGGEQEVIVGPLPALTGRQPVQLRLGDRASNVLTVDF